MCFFFVATPFSQAQYYYQPYPITAQITSNSNGWRLECSVYDSLLGSTQYYNGPWCSQVLTLLNDSIGMAGYWSQFTNSDYFRGVVTYDMELHSFAALNDSCTFCSESYLNSVVSNGRFIYRDEIDPVDYINRVDCYYYDLKTSSWKGTGHMGEEAFFGSPNGYNIFFGESIFEGGEEVNFVFPALNNWGSVWSNSWTYASEGVDVIGDLAYDEGYNNYESEYYGGFVLIHPTFGVTPDLYYENGKFFLMESRNVFFQNYLLNTSNTHFQYSTCDIDINAWQTDSMNDANTNSIKGDKNIFCVIDTSNSIITYGAYSFPQHTWKISSDTVNYIISDTIINGTIFFTDSSGNSYVRGYVDSLGWGNYNTPPQPIFCLFSYNTASTGNLVYIKDYSIGTDSVLFDYGDGFTTNHTFDYHLYKVNGHYRSASAANFNVCMTGYQNGVASAPSCQVVNFVTALDEPVKQTPIAITSKGNFNILDITNKEGHALQVKVFDVAGRQIRSFNNSVNQLLVSLKTLSTGMYVVQVYDEQTHDTITGKFVKK